MKFRFKNGTHVNLSEIMGKRVPRAGGTEGKQGAIVKQWRNLGRRVFLDKKSGISFLWQQVEIWERGGKDDRARLVLGDGFVCLSKVGNWRRKRFKIVVVKGVRLSKGPAEVREYDFEVSSDSRGLCSFFQKTNFELEKSHSTGYGVAIHSW